MDIRDHNRKAWDHQAKTYNRWTIPASDDDILEAQKGNCRIFLTPSKPIPVDWLMPLVSRKVLCLASGGGQQGPLLAAAGAEVTVFDNSPEQLARDRLAANKHRLDLKTVEGDMSDLSFFPDNTFDLIVHPVSNLFVPNILPVWQEAFRVLQEGGELLSGFNNPVRYIFDEEDYEKGVLTPKYAIPYSDLDYLDQDEAIKKRIEGGSPLEFCHTLEDQISGQIEAGLVIIGFYEDRDLEEDHHMISRFMPTYMATRAWKVRGS
ncbi:MAG: class I SAM-dependent methyltransferase [Desulfobacteraceae bacterium]|nr:class I SAM-dependent methyltransferase [Desulfobacteraceae bacterium]